MAHPMHDKSSLCGKNRSFIPYGQHFMQPLYIITGLKIKLRKIDFFYFFLSPHPLRKKWVKIFQSSNLYGLRNKLASSLDQHLPICGWVQEDVWASVVCLQTFMSKCYAGCNVQKREIASPAQLIVKLSVMCCWEHVIIVTL